MAVLREEGTNGDRELGAAFHAAGFEVWDVNLSDLIQGTITLESFRGIAFAGGFRYECFLCCAAHLEVFTQVSKRLEELV